MYRDPLQPTRKKNEKREKNNKNREEKRLKISPFFQAKKGN